ncbi:class I SAM-dependent methyltransferase [Cellvibrio japonicus]|uniref:Predicted SAM-dependent methyltransferase n=1 Tax=Cellvibrio japonicus (strain Ueda107) TaxID=498211 RepID=B3PK12_CELJU|nr:class I SAM-dependent methyltransferase [Cellvibrio japonicus]ACE84297.1 predicted SAM-dependent methyltransferase [Cellvibrio japonicus Ueda107]QEI12779.1 methyltransferase [Cellvibrio japonicus]QEI16353.1 methyltransferase [Cellvibrio japonicus]QEI19931.1 methyltransferase [Cellvibrio japonicus]
MQAILDALGSWPSRAQESRRLFHGRGRCFPGLEFVTLDYFSPVLLLTLYETPPAPDWVDRVASAARPLAPGVQALVVQHRYQVGAPSQVFWGDLPEPLYARRGRLCFHVHLARQQNAGFFLDMEPGRQWLEQQAINKRVLNLFAYTCAFSVVALAAGAEKVVNVDMSSAALNLGRANHQLNNLDKRGAEFLAEDILKSWGRIKRRGPFDLVILDPPSYQKGSFIAQKDYAKLVRRLPELMPAGGLVLACLNAPELGDDFLKAVFAASCPEAKLLERLVPHTDFPDAQPERQLKLLVYQLPPGINEPE